MKAFRGAILPISTVQPATPDGQVRMPHRLSDRIANPSFSVMVESRETVRAAPARVP